MNYLVFDRKPLFFRSEIRNPARSVSFQAVRRNLALTTDFDVRILPEYDFSFTHYLEQSKIENRKS